jgi:hypothetical protein
MIFMDFQSIQLHIFCSPGESISSVSQIMKTFCIKCSAFLQKIHHRRPKDLFLSRRTEMISRFSWSVFSEIISIGGKNRQGKKYWRGVWGPREKRFSILGPFFLASRLIWLPVLRKNNLIKWKSKSSDPGFLA